MGLRVAVANGNWSSPSTWNGGVLPAAGDVVASNGFTVTIDQNINVDSITNAAQSIVTAIPTMTSYTTPSGIVTTSSDSSGNRAWNAFDGSYSLTPAWYAATSSVPQWIAYEFTSAIAIDRYYLGLRGDVYDPRDWTFEAWNGTSWIVLHTVTNNITGSYLSPVLGNSTNYIKYRINISATRGNQVIIIEIAMYQYLATSNAVQGGTFNLNSGVTVTCTNSTYGVTCATGTCITYAGTGISTINAHILGSTTGVGTNGIRVTGTGTLNINGNLYGYLTSSGNANAALRIESNAIVNVVGNVRNPNTYTIYISNQCTLNIIGDVYPGTYNGNTTIYNAGANTVINITGNIYGQGGNSGWTMTGVYLGAISTLNITGNLIGSNVDSRSHYLVSVAANAAINVTGNMQSGTNGNIDYGEICFYSTVSSYLNHIGSVIASLSGYALYSIGSGAINLITGPFISATSGMQPFYVTRMHYRRTIGSYFEFRDNSTNGALPPAASAPATRLVAPTTAVDAPSPANVRFGTSYALGSQTGTMRVPVASAVMYGVEVDNTVGTALLSAAQIWNYLRNDINVSGSIGDRLKNCSTVESTGSQIASFKSS